MTALAPDCPWPVEHCRSCGTEIYWALNLSTRNIMPVDVERVAGGNIELDTAGSKIHLRVVKPDPAVQRWRSHFASCPDRREWRRR